MTFLAGQRVRVSARSHDGHHRTPDYVKGKVGTIQRFHGAFANPETRAYGSDGLPEQPLYLVGFEGGTVHDRLCVDVFEHWLEAAE
ncbi:MAG TPA: SH3-like domain-containing protein [Gaiellaceae bacterium]|nr:SH3-like domain-containing protein [Gaiellaceae bacterium]